MKKRIAILFVAVLFFVTALPCFADADAKPYIDFEIKMDQIPEGYTFETEENGGSLFATFTSEDPEAVAVYVSVAYSDAFAGYTLTSDLTEEELEDAKQYLGSDYNSPRIDLYETEYGTTLISVAENDAQSDYADFVTIWNGYFIVIALQKNTVLTDTDFDLALRIASDMWITEQ